MNLKVLGAFAAVLVLCACSKESPTTETADAAGAHQAPVEAAEPPAAATSGAAEGEMCGGIAGIQCAADQYCAMDVGQCGVADASGKCAKKPEVCPEVEAPVCGCDGNRYGNACKAQRAGVNVMHAGECKQ